MNRFDWTDEQKQIISAARVKLAAEAGEQKGWACRISVDKTSP